MYSSLMANSTLSSTHQYLKDSASSVRVKDTLAPCHRQSGWHNWPFSFWCKTTLLTSLHLSFSRTVWAVWEHHRLQAAQPQGRQEALEGLHRASHLLQVGPDGCFVFIGFFFSDGFVYCVFTVLCTFSLVRWCAWTYIHISHFMSLKLSVLKWIAIC